MNAKEGGKEFTRKELYDLLTDMPVRRIAQEYDLDPGFPEHSTMKS